MKVILHNVFPEEWILGVRAAKSLLRDGHKDCIYKYENGTTLWTKRTPAGNIVVRGIDDGF